MKLREDITDYYAPDHERAIKDLIALLKEYPVLCSDVLDMIKEAYNSITDNNKYA